MRRGGKRWRHVPQRFVHQRPCRIIDDVRFNRLAVRRQYNRRQRKPFFDAQPHQFDVLVRDSTELAEPGDVILVIEDRLQRHFVAQGRKRNVKSPAVRNRHQISFKFGLVNRVPETAPKNVVIIFLFAAKRFTVDGIKPFEQSAISCLTRQVVGDAVAGELVVAAMIADPRGEDRTRFHPEFPSIIQQLPDCLRRRPGGRLVRRIVLFSVGGQANHRQADKAGRQG